MDQLTEVDVVAKPMGEICTADGVRLRYREGGSSMSPTLLLLHGYSDSSQSFARVFDSLARRFRVIALDQRGQGASDQPIDGYAMSDLADDAIACLDALEVPRATVIGHSMGSFVAQIIAAHRPERVDALVLVDSADTAGNAVMRELADTVASLSDPVPEEFAREFQLSTIHRRVPDDFMAMAIATSRRMPARIWKALMAGMLADCGGRGARITAPTLLIWGDQDAIFSRAEQDELVASIPGSRLEVFAGTGHAPHWEEPGRFVAAIEAFATAVLQHRDASRRTVATA